MLPTTSKWSLRLIDGDVLENLVGKTDEFVPVEGRWRVYYLGFAWGGWSEAARQFASNFHSTKNRGTIGRVQV